MSYVFQMFDLVSKEIFCKNLIDNFMWLLWLLVVHCPEASILKCLIDFITLKLTLCTREVSFGIRSEGYTIVMKLFVVYSKDTISKF